MTAKVAYEFELEDGATLVSLLPACQYITRRSLGLTDNDPVRYTPKITADDQLQIVVQSPYRVLITGRVSPGILTVTVEDSVPQPQPRVMRMGRIVASPPEAQDAPLFYQAPPSVGPRPPSPTEAGRGGPRDEASSAARATQTGPRPQPPPPAAPPPAPVPGAPRRRARPLDL